MKYKVASKQKTIDYLEINGEPYGIKEMMYAVEKLLECQPYVGRGYILTKGMDEFMARTLEVLAKENMAKRIEGSDGEICGYNPGSDEARERLTKFKE